ncbi:MAG: hypothetical protein AAF495_00025 [Pseudomonadota bacterium]
MALSRNTYETILDLIENKMSCMEGWDQATNRERSKLEACRKELESLVRGSKGRRGQGRKAESPSISEEAWAELESAEATMPGAATPRGRPKLGRDRI